MSFSQALRRLGLGGAGGNISTLRRYAEHWGISIDHFDRNWARKPGRPSRARPLEEILIENSTYSRNHLKERLLRSGLKAPVCEICGQGELWRGHRMALILDHVNGNATDNRIENLRILCPNCNATLPTHCGRKNRLEREPRLCEHCGSKFWPRAPRQRYCSQYCGSRSNKEQRGIPHPERRTVVRPPYMQLLREVERYGYSATGRRYGVSDNAVRKWLRWYAREAERKADHEERRQAQASASEGDNSVAA